jgi:hypothetical protein
MNLGIPKGFQKREVDRWKNRKTLTTKKNEREKRKIVNSEIAQLFHMNLSN